MKHLCHQPIAIVLGLLLWPEFEPFAQIRATAKPSELTSLSTEWHEVGPIMDRAGRKIFFTRSATFGHVERETVGMRTVWESRSLGAMWKVANQTHFSDDRKAARNVIGMNELGDLYVLLRNPKHRRQRLFLYDERKRTWDNMHAIDIPYIKRNVPHYSGCVSSEGDILVLGIASYDTYGVEDIYVSFKQQDSWTPLQNLGETVNTTYQDITPFLLKDGKTLIFASNGHPNNQGSFDLYVTQRLDETWKKWTTPRHLGKDINTRGAEYYFYWKEDTPYAYFSRNLHSDSYSDIYSVAVEWVEEENQLVFKPPPPKEEVFLPEKVLFYRGTSRLLPETERNLDLLVKILLEHPKKKIFISGYTDNRGNFLINLRLSKRRVKKIIAYLVEQGIEPERLEGRGYGSARPIASNKSEKTRRLNRRVEFRFIED